jgi:hypothetical protein
LSEIWAEWTWAEWTWAEWTWALQELKTDNR